MLGFPAPLGQVALAEIPADSGGGGGNGAALHHFPFIANMGTLMKRYVWIIGIFTLLI